MARRRRQRDNRGVEIIMLLQKQGKTDLKRVFISPIKAAFARLKEMRGVDNIADIVLLIVSGRHAVSYPTRSPSDSDEGKVSSIKASSNEVEKPGLLAASVVRT